MSLIESLIFIKVNMETATIMQLSEVSFTRSKSNVPITKDTRPVRRIMRVFLNTSKSFTIENDCIPIWDIEIPSHSKNCKMPFNYLSTYSGEDPTYDSTESKWSGLRTLASITKRLPECRSKNGLRPDRIGSSFSSGTMVKTICKLLVSLNIICPSWNPPCPFPDKLLKIV
jgi:hypothetical protein